MGKLALDSGTTNRVKQYLLVHLLVHVTRCNPILTLVHVLCKKVAFNEGYAGTALIRVFVAVRAAWRLDTNLEPIENELEAARH